VIDANEKVLALLTVLPAELVTLQQYRQLIKIHGTHSNLSLRWHVIPITMLDKGRHLACRGICLAAHFATEVVF
jgi:hypothetical protein